MIPSFSFSLSSHLNHHEILSALPSKCVQRIQPLLPSNMTISGVQATVPSPLEDGIRLLMSFPASSLVPRQSILQTTAGMILQKCEVILLLLLKASGFYLTQSKGHSITLIYWPYTLYWPFLLGHCSSSVYFTSPTTILDFLLHDVKQAPSTERWCLLFPLPRMLPSQRATEPLLQLLHIFL